MPRLVQMPHGLRITGRTLVAGPRARMSSQSESVTGEPQTVSSPFGGWAFRFDFASHRGKAARRLRGWISALHMGSNATRITFCDWRGLSWSDLGTYTAAQIRNGVPFSNNQPFSNGMNWQTPRPHVAVSVAAAKGGTLVKLANEYWRGALDVGDRIGFAPFYFGMHEITEVRAGGEFRITPPLRADITTSHWAHLKPVLVMRPTPGTIPEIADGAADTQPMSITFVEQQDSSVRVFYTE